MSDKKTQMPPFSHGFMLDEAFPQVTSQLIEALNAEPHQELAQQLKLVFVPQQGLSGSSSEFSFMAYPIPRLTLEERFKVQVKAEENIVIRILDGTVKIQTDIFGKISWFWFTDLPQIYSALNDRMKRPPSVHLT